MSWALGKLGIGYWVNWVVMGKLVMGTMFSITYHSTKDSELVIAVALSYFHCSDSVLSEYGYYRCRGWVSTAAVDFLLPLVFIGFAFTNSSLSCYHYNSTDCRLANLNATLSQKQRAHICNPQETECNALPDHSAACVALWSQNKTDDKTDNSLENTVRCEQWGIGVNYRMP